MKKQHEFLTFLDYVKEHKTFKVDDFISSNVAEFNDLLLESSYLTNEQNKSIDIALEAFTKEYNEKGLEIFNQDLTNEGIIGSILGGLTGFALGKTLGQIMAKVLGVEKGILYDLLTSRLVGAAIGAAIGKRI